MLSSLDDLEVALSRDIGSGLKIALICDRDETLGPTPASMDQQSNIIGQQTVHALRQLHGHHRGYVAIVSGRRVSELALEPGVNKLPLFGCTGDWFWSPGHNGCSLSRRPASWDSAKAQISEFSGGATLFTESKLSLCSNERFNEALDLMEKISSQHPGQWVVKNYPMYSLVELLPSTATKANAVDKIVNTIGINRVRYVYLGNGKNDVPAMNYVVKEIGGYAVFVGNTDTENEIGDHCTHAANDFKQVRRFIDWLLEKMRLVAG